MRFTRLAMLATALAVLAVPAAASAHPSVYTGEAIIDVDPDPGEFTPQTQIRHMVTNHGYTTVLRETNGVDAPDGVMSYALLPGDRRAALGPDKTQWLDPGGTGAQAHATCSGVAALSDPDNIVAWQAGDAGEGDPFYNYIPFQKAPAGLEDDPADWIDDVQGLTGVDLTTVSDDPGQAASQLETRCESAAPAGLGGTFAPADETQSTFTSLASGTVTQATAPLTAQITELTTFTQQLEAEKAAAQKAAADAQAALGAAQKAAADAQTTLGAAQAEVARLSTLLRLEPVGSRSAVRRAAAEQDVKVTGPAGMRVVVRLRLTRAAAKAAQSKALVLGKEAVTLGQDGTATVDFALARKAQTALRKAKSSGVYFTARSGDRYASTRGR
jgi:hypothetical protein